MAKTSTLRAVDDDPDSDKLSKGSVNYSSAGLKNSRCGNCKYFQGNACEIVAGHIEASMWCEEWEADEIWGPRDEELCHDEEIEEQVLKKMRAASKGFKSQWERGNDQLDWWDVYNCVLGGHQAYQGNSQIFIPLVHEAINARKTRFVNQVFPRSGRNVDCISSDEKPYSIMALLEHYIRKTKLRTQILPALLKNGDVEGQYNLYVGWESSSRYVAYRKPATMEIEGEEIESVDPEAEDDVLEEQTFHEQPVVEVLADNDVLVLPHTATSVGHALAQGGIVAVIRKWTEDRVERAIEDGEIDEEAGENLLEEMRDSKDDPNAPDADKKHVDAAGITL